MIIDNELELVTATNYDLGAPGPGKGKEICVQLTGVGGSVSLFTADTEAGMFAATSGTALLVIDATEDLSFTLPSTTKQWYQLTFAAGTAQIVPNVQTNL